MTVKCPNCKNETNELMSCDNCNAVGCVRCVSKHGKQWLCINCRKGVSSNSSSYSQPSPNQSSNFPNWFG